MFEGRQLILGLDSCGAETTLALGELFGSQLRVLREATLPARSTGARLTGALGEVLGEVAPAALAAMVVVRGPGSFTGMRIGLSAAKALSEAAAVPLVAVSRLAVLAAAGRTEYAALDAGRGSVYLRASNGAEQLLSEDKARGAAQDLSALAVCEDRVAGLFPGARSVAQPRAIDALAHARERVAARDWDDPGSLDALYLWQAEQMLRTAGG